MQLYMPSNNAYATGHYFVKSRARIPSTKLPNRQNTSDLNMFVSHEFSVYMLPITCSTVAE